MPSLNVRNFPDELLYELKSAAHASRVTLRDYVIAALESASYSSSASNAIEHIPREVTKVTLPKPEVIRPSMDHLRDIAAGIITVSEVRSWPAEPLQPVPGPPQEREMCDYKQGQAHKRKTTVVCLQSRGISDA